MKFVKIAPANWCPQGRGLFGGGPPNPHSSLARPGIDPPAVRLGLRDALQTHNSLAQFSRISFGFTLVEFILATTLTLILFGVTAMILNQGIRSYAHISERDAQLQQTRFAMEHVVRELRALGDGQNSNVQQIQNNRITFIDTLGASVTFQLQGQTLLRDNDPLLFNVTSLTFTGYQANNGTTNSGQQVRRVQIRLTTLPQGQTAPLTLETDVFLRNFIYENFK